MNNDDQQVRAGGPDVLHARVYGNSIPELKLAALDQARGLWGESAVLRIEDLDVIETSLSTDLGRFWTYVTVRCVNLPDEDR